MSVPGPLTGPCTAWIEGAGVVPCCPGYDGTDEVTLERLEAAALAASDVLYVLSGRQYGGLCRSVTRPGASQCGCFGTSSGLPSHWVWGLAGYDPTAGLWRGECGERSSCPPLSIVKLAPYPVREVEEVKIGGEVLDPSAYRLDRGRELVRVDGGRWPSCQNQALADDQPGTFSITYSHGVDPPELGRLAAAEVACEILRSCGDGGGTCDLPSGVVSIARQGITIDRDKAIVWLSRTSRSDGRPDPTGLPNLDLFLLTYWPYRNRRRAAVMSPDVRGFGRRTPLGPAAP